jgi:hypothetical protein
VLPSDRFAMALSTLAAEIDTSYVPESLCKEIAVRIGAGCEGKWAVSVAIARERSQPASAILPN